MQLTPEETTTLRGLGAVVQHPRLKPLVKLAQDLDLFAGGDPAKAMAALASNCTHSRLVVHCEDRTVDLCPGGHLVYGLATLALLALPGMLLAVSAFVHFRCFRFGMLGGRMYGQGWGKAARLVLLPLYVVAMVPLVVVITVVQ